MEIVFILLLIYFYRQTKPRPVSVKGKPSKKTAVIKNYGFSFSEKEWLGQLGKKKSLRHLKKLPYEKRLLQNLYIPREDGSTTEIDLVMISETGIYVVESKNFSGWIFGSDRDKYWTQTLKNGKKYKFFNPVWQNEGQIKALQEVLDLKEDRMYRSYIVFSLRSVIKSMSVTRKHVVVMNRDDLYETALEDGKTRETVFTREKVQEIYDLLEPYTKASPLLKEKHNRKIEGRIEEPSKVIAFPVANRNSKEINMDDLDGASRKVIPLEMKERQ